MQKLYELRDKLVKELKRYADGEISNNTLPHIDTLAHSIKNLDKVIAECEAEREDEYRGMSYGRMRHDGVMYDGSYRRQKRDSMGRYSRAGIVDKLRERAEDAPDERMREELHRMVQQMDQ